VTRGRGALILAHGRQELLDQTIAAIKPQVDTVMVIDNASDPKLTVPKGVGSMYLPEQPPVLSRFWNIGLEWFVRWYASQDRCQDYDVAVMCDDAIAPPGWFAAVVEAMRETGAVAGSSSPWSQPRIMKYDMDGDIRNRMCSWAFIVDGASKVRADESMSWWWFDSDFDIALRRNGGTVLIGTHPVPNQQPNYYTVMKPELGEQAGRDRATFVMKHGTAPW
jgi:glycosyltransferase involved in cell wall biosynthesis